jgi:hypothetical protein
VYLTWWKNLGKAHWRHELEIKCWLPPTDFKNLHQKRNVTLWNAPILSGKKAAIIVWRDSCPLNFVVMEG